MTPEWINDRGFGIYTFNTASTGLYHSGVKELYLGDKNSHSRKVVTFGISVRRVFRLDHEVFCKIIYAHFLVIMILLLVILDL
jgi:hypothetical protein